VTSADLIRAAGEALYGPRYESGLAIALKVNRRTVRRWKSGEHEPRAGVWDDLLTLMTDRCTWLDSLRAEIHKRL
jgi:hypothetical protein